MDLEARAVCMATETLLPWELRVCFRRVTHDGAGHDSLDIRWELHLSVNNDLVQDNVWLLWLQKAHYHISNPQNIVSSLLCDTA